MPRKKNRRKEIQRAKRKEQGEPQRRVTHYEPPQVGDFAAYQQSLSLAVASAFAAPHLLRKIRTTPKEIDDA